jgi:excinuclease ABC subunit B
MDQQSILDIRGKKPVAYIEDDHKVVAADPLVGYLSKDQLQQLIKETEEKMKKAAKELDFITAASLRDEINMLKKKLTI